MGKLISRLRALWLLLVCLLLPSQARAFCGFFVSGADGTLVNDATQVALMRKGVRTMLAMRNSYQGPLDDFALVNVGVAAVAEVRVSVTSANAEHPKHCSQRTG